MSDFHFIRPFWLLAIIVVFIALYLLKKYRLSQSGWQQFLPQHLAKVLLDGASGEQKSKNKPKTLIAPFVIGLISVIALAGPTWEKLPQPVYQIERGSVLIMDMSYSMYATDLLPNRLTHAKFKASDLLDQLVDGDVGLVAYAGDAFIISPLTADVNNIKLLLPALSPDIMPELGSNPVPALMLADEMLRNAGHISGDIYWLTDGIDSEDIQDIHIWSKEVPHRLNILGIGTKNGAPIKLTNGELLKDRSGAIVIPKLTKAYLRRVATLGHGDYQNITNDLSDVTALVNSSPSQDGMTDTKTVNLEQGDQWHEMGPYLVLLLLPLVLGYFRRGFSLAILPLSLLLLPVDSVYASVWSDLWKTKDQQAQKKFNDKEYLNAAEQFNSSNWQGSAYYKAKDYENALAAFQKDSSANGLYNQGNALAQLNKLDEAIKAYEKALELEPNLTDAIENKKKLEQLKKQQDQQENNENQENQDQNEDGEQKENDKDKQQSQDQEDSEQQNKDQQKSDQQDSNNKQGQDNKEQSEQDKQQDSEQDKQESKDKEEQEKNKDEQANNEDKKQGESDKQPLSAQEQEKLDQELEEKHLQLINKITDDPYLLLRNKMQLEYKKRRQEGYRSGVNKKW